MPLAPGVEVVHVDAGPARPVPKDDLLPFVDDLAAGIAADWESGPPDVVHGHFWMSGLAALEAARAAAETFGVRPRVLETFHALGSVKRRHQGGRDTSPAQRAWLEPAVARRVDRIVARCADEVRELTALGADPARISVAPSGVNLELFAATGPAEPVGERRRIAVVGRLVERKGIDLAIAALRLLVDQGVDDVELHIVGGCFGAQGLEDDPEALRLREVAADLEVLDRVVFRGQLGREDMPAMLRSCTAVVCSPWYEPFGLVPLEAMACRVPVVATAVGGLQDSVVHKVTGLHVPPRNFALLADALHELLDDPRLCRRLGRAGRRRVEHGYSWDRVAALTEDAYLLALAEGGAARVAAGDGRPVPIATTS